MKYYSNVLVFVMHVAVIYFLFLFCICAFAAVVTIVVQYLHLHSESKQVTAMPIWVSRDSISKCYKSLSIVSQCQTLFLALLYMSFKLCLLYVCCNASGLQALLLLL